jgi:hypothetical protein
MSGWGQERELVSLRRGLTAYEMVHPMGSRIFTAGFIVVSCLGSMLIPNETFGRSGGAGGNSTSGFHSSNTRSSNHIASRNGRSGRHRGDLGLGVPLYAPGYYPSSTNSVPSDATSPGPPVYVEKNSPQLSEPRETVSWSIPLAFTPGCSSQTVTVPWASGKTHAVSIVRC